jgi:uncharacterized membrane protein YfcA
MDEYILILLPIFFTIAVLYSSAGFGGGSSYLAVLALFPLEFTTIRMVALLCNINVVSGSVYIFYKNGFFHFRKIWPLILLSVPFAYLGGSLRIGQEVFFIILGSTLLIASMVMLLTKQEQTLKLPKYSNAIIGGGIGFLSGIVGIGGGIFLSPLLYLSRWAAAKVIAATTASFILVNSIAGLVGQISTNGFGIDLKLTGILLFTVFIGGQIGVRLTAHRIAPQLLRRITAILIFIVAIRILWKYFYI